MNGVEHQYTTLDGKVIREAFGDVTVDYFYDNEGKPYKIVVDDNGTVTSGYYVLNQQGDVIAILNSSGTQEVVYEYNAWGKITREDSVQANGNAASTTSPLETYNALKYRGYYYDAETGFYYVSSRYYDPVIGRFISADTTDVLTVSPTALTDKNLYAYCDNNPVMRVDSTGEFWNIAAGAIIGGAISAATQIAANVISGENWSKGVLMATVTGAASGALASTGIGLVGQVLGNAGISAASEVASQLKDGNTDISSIVINAGIMAVVGGVSGAIGGPGIRAKGTAYRKSIDTLNSVKGNISKALSNPKGYRHQINSAIKNHVSTSRTAVKSTAKSFTKASAFATFCGRVKSWFSR